MNPMTASDPGEPHTLPAWAFEPFTLADHFSDEEIDLLCGVEVFDDALVAALRGLGMVPRVQRLFDAVVVVASPSDGNWFLSGLTMPLTLTPTSEPQGWDDVGAGTPPERLRARRAQILQEVIHGLDPMHDSPTVVLERPLKNRANAKDVDRTLEAALGVWWDLRILEGHTAESAQTMLALIVDPSVQPCLRFDDTGPRLIP